MSKLFRERVAEARAQSYTPSFEKVSAYIEANVLEAALSTAYRLGQETGVDAATVVRMSQRLGYEGWPELREELAAGIIDGTDVVPGAEPPAPRRERGAGVIPLLQGHRGALEAQREALQGAVETVDAEIAWIDKALARCEAGE